MKKDEAIKLAQQDIQRLSALVRAQQITIDKLEAQRTWVGLNDTDLAVCGDEDELLMARFWERVCKEKNT